MIKVKTNPMKYKDSNGNMIDVGGVIGKEVTDLTLTKSNVPADSKTVGDKLNQLSQEKVDQADAVLVIPQTLTDDQKAQARTNIGAASEADKITFSYDAENKIVRFLRAGGTLLELPAAQDGEYYKLLTDEDLTESGVPADAKAVGDRFAELKETLLNKLTLGYGTDGKIYTYFDRKPIGTGIGVASDETVSGTINEDNNLIFNDNIPDGEYSLYFLSENNVYSDAMDMVVSEIAVEEESEITNLISAALDPNVTDIYNGVGWKANVRWSTSGAKEVTLDNCVFTGLIPIGASGDVFRTNLSVEYSSANRGQILFYALDGTLITSSFKVVSQYATCNNTYTQWVFGGGSERVPDDAYYFRVVLSPYSDNPIITRNQEIEESTEEDYLGVNLLTMENLEIKLNQRYSGSSFAYIDCAGMIAFMIPMTQVLNRKIRFIGFEYGAKVASQPLWFTLDNLNNSLGYLTGTSSSTGIWGSEYLTQEDDGSCTLPINSDTIPTAGAVTLVINMVVDPDASRITKIPDTMSIVIEEDE